MKRDIFIMCLLVLSLALYACNEQKTQTETSSQPKIATIDTDKVFQQSKLAGEAMQFIEEQHQIFNQKVYAFQKQVEDDPENVELSMKLQAELNQLQQKLEQDQMEAAEKITGAFNSVIEEYRKANNLEVILPTQMIIASAPDAEITNAIVELMDKKSIDFFEGKERLAQPEAEPAEPAEQ